jgi:hypothetical protein
MSNFTIYDPLTELAAEVAKLESGDGGGGGGGSGGLPSTGGTLSGNLTLTSPAKVIQSAAPTDSNDLTNKAYVDSQIAAAPYLPLSGGTMSGQILQPLAPTTANDVVNKAYVDSAVGSGSGGPYLPLTGGTMTGAINQPIAPVANTDVTNKLYVDSKITTPGLIPGASIADASITNNQMLAGPPNTLKGTNSLGNVDDLVIGNGLTLSAGSGGALSVNTSELFKAGNTQFGTVEFDPSGDLVETSTNSGIALIKKPGSGAIISNAGFDDTGKFVASDLGALQSSGLLADGATFTSGNLMFRVNNVEPMSLQMHFVSGPGGYIVGGAQPYWDAESPPVPEVTGRYIYRNVGTTNFISLSERVAGEPTGSQLVKPAFNTTGWGNVDPSETGAGYVEIYNIFVNDGIDNGIFRITVNQVNFPNGVLNSYIAVERLSA